MGVSHIAIAVKDMAATHRFYTEAMGFALVKVEAVPQHGGTARHAFYSTGSRDGQMIAFWDLSRVPRRQELKTDICRDLGLDPLTNHIAFSADDPSDLERRKQRWLAAGHDVLEVDHGWVHSIYTEDPDGIAVEFAFLTQVPSAEDAAEAEALLFGDDAPPGGAPQCAGAQGLGGRGRLFLVKVPARCSAPSEQRRAWRRTRPLGLHLRRSNAPIA